jgi:hypothetical protein
MAMIFSFLVLHASALSQTNQVNSPSINSVTNAAYYAGTDCGTRIMAADAAWSGVPVEIDVTQACGTTIGTAVNPTAGHVLRFTQPGTYTLTGNVAFTLAATEGRCRAFRE